MKSLTLTHIYPVPKVTVHSVSEKSIFESMKSVVKYPMKTTLKGVKSYIIRKLVHFPVGIYTFY